MYLNDKKAAIKPFSREKGWNSYFYMVFCVFISKCEILIYGFEISQPTRQMPIKSTAHMRITYAFINQLMTCRFHLMFAIQFARFFSFFFWIVILLWSLSRYDRILIQLLSQLIRIKSLSLYPSLRPFFPFLSLRNSNHIAFCRFTKTLNGSIASAERRQ